VAADAGSLQAGEDQSGNFLPCAAPHGSTLAMRGVPMGVIAEQLGHADTRMTEKHYAHLAPSYVADTIRAHFPTVGITGETNLVKLKRKPRSHGTERSNSLPS